MLGDGSGPRLRARGSSPRRRSRPRRMKALPAQALFATIPSLLLVKPVAWRSATCGSPSRSPPSGRTSSGTWPRTPASPRRSWPPSCSLSFPRNRKETHHDATPGPRHSAPRLGPAATAALAADVPAGFTPLFNGKDLTGWHVSQVNHHGNSKGWSVKDGVVLATQDRPGNGGSCSPTASTRLRGLARDQPRLGLRRRLFLRATRRARLPGHDRLPRGRQRGRPLRRGPRGQSFAVNKEWPSTGRKASGTGSRPDRGDVPHIRVWLNDAPVVDFTDTANHAKGGATDGMIALQMHFSNEKTPRWKEAASTASATSR